jgi:hypothetical protein
MQSNELILEGIITTLNADRSVNISPMGPRVDREITRLVLRPYQTSRTYENLKRHGEGVFHVTDDVELLARSAVDQLLERPRLVPAPLIDGQIIADACRWYAFRIARWDDREPRATIDCEVVEQGRIRDFLGFNRGKHAVLEAAILATRLHLLPRDQVEGEFDQLSVWVEKTGGAQERRAFALLRAFARRYHDESSGQCGPAGA